MAGELEGREAVHTVGPSPQLGSGHMPPHWSRGGVCFAAPGLPSLGWCHLMAQSPTLAGDIHYGFIT